MSNEDGINQTIFDNGFTVLTDSFSSVDTLSIYLSVNIGSRNESISQHGISHFLEHMAFKGTRNRNAFEIAKEIDQIGGYMNAYTSKENTCYYIKILKNHTEKAIDILSDVFQNSIIDATELETERGVILQEIAASNDDSDDVLFDMIYEQSFGHDTNLGRNIIGTPENIKSFSRNDIINYIDLKYSSKNTILGFSGNINHEDALILSKKYFTNLNNKNTHSYEKVFFNKGIINKTNSKLEQAKLVIAFKNNSYELNKDFYISQLASMILGQGMSSRLFQEIREKRGLVYSIDTFVDSYSDIGLFGIYAGTSDDKVKDVINITIQEIEKLASNLSEDELQKSINQYVSLNSFSMESTNFRAQKLTSNFHRYGKYITQSEIISFMSSITAQDLMEYLSRMLSQDQKSIAIYSNQRIYN